MNKMINDAIKLHKHFGFKKPTHPTPLDNDLMGMRLNFLFEELKETAEASGFYWNPAIHKFQPAKKKMVNRDAENILDGLVDIMVVVLGTAHLIGFIDDAEKTIFEIAWDRVFKANISKKVGITKRGHKIDLIKPPGWKPPQFSDLVAGFYGYCKDCKCALTKEAYQKDELKCSACQEAS
jgi:predicted HAD superfamily Cof-like phosphohydrolase